LIYPENAERRWVVANADGTRRDTVTLSAGQSIHRVAARIHASRRLGRKCSAPRPSGSRWALADRRDAAESPWIRRGFPDGRFMTVFSRAASDVELRILNADGSGRRALPLRRTSRRRGVVAGREVDCVRRIHRDMPPHFAAIEVATGRRLALHDFGDRSGMSVRWQPDSSRNHFRPKHSTRRTRSPA